MTWLVEIRYDTPEIKDCYEIYSFTDREEAEFKIWKLVHAISNNKKYKLISQELKEIKDHNAKRNHR